MNRFHPLNTDIGKPAKFTFPFCYKPHPLCLLAAEEVQRYIAKEDCWKNEIAHGKMFGVLVVTKGDELGYLAAYSGLLNGSNDLPFFVPAVYDLLRPDGYFKTKENKISIINKCVEALENDNYRLQLITELENLKQEASVAIDNYKSEMQEAKKQRDEARAKGDGDADEAIIKQSQFMKAELRRIKKRYAKAMAETEMELKAIDTDIMTLKDSRKKMSDALQMWLFSQFSMLNARGERRDLCDIFATTAGKVPPSGAGECCAPKLLQYAYLNGLHPVCMAEFWWGESPKTEIRHHLHYYPACQGKCKPILTHMLQGLNVDSDPLSYDTEQNLEVIYDDKWLAVICKPAGMLSVPGKSNRRSVLSIMQQRYPEAEGPMIVHRLDMATSGLMVVAKTKYVHQQLQAQFKNRTIKKRYVAILHGETDKAITDLDGVIDLPLRPDHLNRPRQIVDYEYGKSAITEYHIISVCDDKVRVALYPKTGRTHQLRVHCAHPDGLGIPIIGDALYGKGVDRLFLHAEYLEFTHPMTGKTMCFEKKADF